jgi:signal transduction histidine kinase
VADLLEEVGFAYFVSDAKGRVVFSNQKDQEILEASTELIYRRERREWFADPHEFDEIVERSLSSPNSAISKRVLLRTHGGRAVWAEAALRVVKGSNDSLSRIEGAYRDVNLEERLAKAISDISSLELGLAQTAAEILNVLVTIIDNTSSAIIVRDPRYRRLFPLCLRGERQFGKELILKDIDDWWNELRPQEPARIYSRQQVPQRVVQLLGDNAATMHSLCVLPLQRTPDGMTAAIWLAMPERPGSEPAAPMALTVLLQLCQRQLRLANTRDAFDLIRSLMSRRTEITTLNRLDKFLCDARLALENYVPMEGCSIFRVGLEDRETTLTLCATSGLETPSPQASYHFGEGMTGSVAERGERLTFDMKSEKDRRGKHIEKVPHPITTWAGVPMLDRKGRTVGVLRCVNRKVSPDGGSEVTGFSDFDMTTLRQFADACGLLIELTHVDAYRQRMVARIAHEIRTPIVAIRNNLEFLSDHYAPHDEKTKAKLADLELDATILLDQVRKLDVVFNQPGATAVDPAQPVQLSEILWKTYYTMVPELNARNIKTTPNRAMEVIGRLPSLWLPKAAIAQIVFNLLWNAIKYSHHDPSKFKISVILEDWDDSYYKIRFRDQGIGIAPQYRTQIFDENFRTPEARAHDARGFGLGLALSRRLARKLHGDLTLSSGGEVGQTHVLEPGEARQRGHASARHPGGTGSSTTEFVLTLPKSLSQKPIKISKVE